MGTTPEHRRSPRLPVPAPLSGRGMGQLQVRLLDLSPEGARVEHVHPFPDRRLCFLDLPPALGGGSLQGEVVWSQEGGRKEVAEGDWVVSFESGLRFTVLTVGQQASLTVALDIVKETPKG